MPKCVCAIKNNVLVLGSCQNRAKYKVKCLDDRVSDDDLMVDVCEEHYIINMDVVATYQYTEVTIVQVIPVELQEIKIDCVFEG